MTLKEKVLKYKPKTQRLTWFEKLSRRKPAEAKDLIDICIDYHSGKLLHIPSVTELYRAISSEISIGCCSDEFRRWSKRIYHEFERQNREKT